MRRGGKEGKQARSFLKKRTKKLFPVLRSGPGAKSKSLFASFSSEKEESCFRPVDPPAAIAQHPPT
jgi:hypothetical protein